MDRLKFNGLINNISPRQLAFVQEVLRNLGYTEGIVKVSSACKEGENFSMDNIRRFTIKKKGQTFNLIAKIAPNDKQKRAVICYEKVFSNENFIYNKVLPTFANLEKTVGVPENERIRYAKHFGSLTEQPYEILLLEDLEVDGFTMPLKNHPLTEEHVKAVLKNIAALNAACFASKVLTPEDTNYFYNNLYNVYVDINKQIMAYYDSVEVDTLNILEEEKYRKPVKGMVSEYFRLEQCWGTSTNDNKYCVIGHGDVCCTNFMFQQTEDNSTVCCLIDYQCAKMMSPVVDLLFIVFTCTNYEMRKTSFFEWMDYYHSQLDYFLSYYGLKAEDAYPRAQLDKDLKEYAKLGLCRGIVHASNVLRSETEARKYKAVYQEPSQDIIEASTLSKTNANTIAKFKSTVEGLIDSCYELKLLDE